MNLIDSQGGNRGNGGEEEEEEEDLRLLEETGDRRQETGDRRRERVLDLLLFHDNLYLAGC